MPQSGSATPKTKRQGFLSNDRKRWDKEGEDAVHLTKKILANFELKTSSTNTAIGWRVTKGERSTDTSTTNRKK